MRLADRRPDAGPAASLHCGENLGRSFSFLICKMRAMSAILMVLVYNKKTLCKQNCLRNCGLLLVVVVSFPGRETAGQDSVIRKNKIY